MRLFSSENEFMSFTSTFSENHMKDHPSLTCQALGNQSSGKPGDACRSNTPGLWREPSRRHPPRSQPHPSSPRRHLSSRNLRPVYHPVTCPTRPTLRSIPKESSYDRSTLLLHPQCLRERFDETDSVETERIIVLTICRVHHALPLPERLTEKQLDLCTTLDAIHTIKPSSSFSKISLIPPPTHVTNVNRPMGSPTSGAASTPYSPINSPSASRTKPSPYGTTHPQHPTRSWTLHLRPRVLGHQHAHRLLSCAHCPQLPSLPTLPSFPFLSLPFSSSPSQPQPPIILSVPSSWTSTIILHSFFLSSTARLRTLPCVDRDGS